MVDGPYIFERDILGGLKGGKGTFFLNVSHHPSSSTLSVLGEELMNRVRTMTVFIITLMMFDIWIHSTSLLFDSSSSAPLLSLRNLNRQGG
jgi:hypothetical protein